MTAAADDHSMLYTIRDNLLATFIQVCFNLDNANDHIDVKQATYACQQVLPQSVFTSANGFAQFSVRECIKCDAGKDQVCDPSQYQSSLAYAHVRDSLSACYPVVLTTTTIYWTAILEWIQHHLLQFPSNQLDKTLDRAEFAWLRSPFTYIMTIECKNVKLPKRRQKPTPPQPPTANAVSLVHHLKSVKCPLEMHRLWSTFVCRWRQSSTYQHWLLDGQIAILITQLDSIWNLGKQDASAAPICAVMNKALKRIQNAGECLTYCAEIRRTEYSKRLETKRSRVGQLQAERVLLAKAVNSDNTTNICKPDKRHYLSVVAELQYWKGRFIKQWKTHEWSETEERLKALYCDDRLYRLVVEPEQQDRYQRVIVILQQLLDLSHKPTLVSTRQYRKLMNDLWFVLNPIVIDTVAVRSKLEPSPLPPIIVPISPSEINEKAKPMDEKHSDLVDTFKVGHHHVLTLSAAASSPLPLANSWVDESDWTDLSATVPMGSFLNTSTASLPFQLKF